MSKGIVLTLVGIIASVHGNETINFQNDKSEKNWNFSPAAKSADPKGLLFGLSKIMNFELSRLTFNPRPQPHRHYQSPLWVPTLSLRTNASPAKSSFPEQHKEKRRSDPLLLEIVGSSNRREVVRQSGWRTMNPTDLGSGHSMTSTSPRS